MLLDAHSGFVVHRKDILQANEGGDIVTDLSWLQPNNYSCMILSHVIVLFCISHSPSQSHELFSQFSTVHLFSCFASSYAIIIEVDSLNCYCDLLRDTTTSTTESELLKRELEMLQKIRRDSRIKIVHVYSDIPDAQMRR